MNLPNLLTLSRVPFLFAIVAMLAFPWPGSATCAFVLFIIAAVTDWLDGHFARRYRMVSNFGKLMDALTDKILMVGLFFALMTLDLMPAPIVLSLFLVLLILSREFFITGLRLVAAANGVVLAAEKAGKQKTVTQLLAMGFLLAAPVIGVDFARLLGTDFDAFAGVVAWIGYGLFGLAALLTVSSGTMYIVKYRDQLFPDMEDASK